MDHMSPGKLIKYLTGGATALILLWVGSIVVSQFMLAIIPLLFMILAFGLWWNMFTGGKK